jgi:hypothetical protein
MQLSFDFVLTHVIAGRRALETLTIGSGPVSAKNASLNFMYRPAHMA